MHPSDQWGDPSRVKPGVTQYRSMVVCLIECDVLSGHMRLGQGGHVSGRMRLSEE